MKSVIFLICVCCALAQDATVSFDLPSNQVLFSNPITVGLSIKGPAGGQIRYTLNGGTPSARSTLYTSPIRIADRSAVIRATVVTNGKPGPVALRGFVRIDPGMSWKMSNLPVVILETFGEQNFENTDKKERPVYVVGLEPKGGNTIANERVVFHGMAQGKVRGSSSASFAKKQFGIEFVDGEGEDEKVAAFGMPKESKWVMYAASEFDRTWVHNAMMYQVSREFFKHWAPRTQFCEVLLNKDNIVGSNDYQGSYTWMEKPGRSKSRINVEKEGGWILKVDRPDPKDAGKDVFQAGVGTFVLEYPSAKKITPQQLSWVKAFWGGLNAQLDRREVAVRPKWFDSIDVTPTIDFHLMKYFSKDVDAFALSTFLHKTAGGRFRWGPVWDFDRAFGCSDDSRCSGPEHDRDSAGNNPFGHGFWAKFFADPQFVRRYTQRYHQLRSAGWGATKVCAIIDKLAAQMSPSSGRNIARWPAHAPEGGYLARVERLKTWVRGRFAYLDRRMCYRVNPTCQDNDPCTDSICSVVDGSCRIIPNGCPKPKPPSVPKPASPKPARASEDMGDLFMAMQDGSADAPTTTETTATTPSVSPVLIAGLVVGALTVVTIAVIIVLIARRSSVMKATEIVP